VNGLNAYTERLADELAEVREQLGATSEVLAVIGRSASDLEGVLETVVESARKLCGADAGGVYLVDGDRYRFAYGSGMTAEYREFITNNPVVLDRATLVGRVGVDRRATQITDVLADPDYGRPDVQRVGGYRTIMGVPMLLDGEVVGVLSVWRTQVDPFSDRAVEVLTTFAAQAALAVRTVDLVRALGSRTDELGRKVNQLEALGAVGEAVSSSLNLTEVLNTIVTQAVLLSGTYGGSVYEFDEDAKEFRIRTVCGTSPAVLDALRRTRIGLDDTFLGKAAKQGRPMELPDLRDAPLDPHLSVLAEGGWRSLVAVPMLREGRIIGALVVSARDGEEGLDTVRRLSPVGVILDILLPGIDGWEVLARLKADPRTTAIPVIVVSMLDERGRGFALGAAEYLVKPVGKEQLLAALYRAAAMPERKHTVVAIDDDPLAIELVRAGLEPEGWTVLGAATGQEGLALIRERQPSAVLLDLLMPGMDGFEVVEALRSDPDTKSVPVVILTSKSMTQQDKERLQGRITYVARKTEFDLSGLAGLLRWASTSRQSPASESG
jgi:CheY-like chemotaxis protein